MRVDVLGQGAAVRPEPRRPTELQNQVTSASSTIAYKPSCVGGVFPRVDERHMPAVRASLSTLLFRALIAPERLHEGRLQVEHT